MKIIRALLVLGALGLAWWAFWQLAHFFGLDVLFLLIITLAIGAVIIALGVLGLRGETHG